MQGIKVAASTSFLPPISGPQIRHISQWRNYRPYRSSRGCGLQSPNALASNILSSRHTGLFRNCLLTGEYSTTDIIYLYRSNRTSKASRHAWEGAIGPTATSLRV